MKRNFVLLLICGSVLAGEPFRIPPSGQQQRIQSEMRCPTASMIAFDKLNRPYLVDTRDPKRYGLVSTLRDGKWVEKSFVSALNEAGFALMPNCITEKDFGTITFDKEDSLYILIPTPNQRNQGAAGEVEINGNVVLLYSKDYGDTFKVYRLDARPYLSTMETSTGNGTLDHPPALILGKAVNYVKDTYVNVRGRRELLRFCEFDQLKVVFPQKTADGLSLPPPVLVTEKANGVTGHSGGMNVGASKGGKFYVTYIEVPENLESGRNPVWIAEIDRLAGTVLNRKRLLDSYPEEADTHSTPSMVVDRRGTLHVVAGSHAWTQTMQGFYYLQSIGDGIEKWTAPLSLGKMQTYAALTIDSQGNLHLAYRYTPDLAYMRRNAFRGDWSQPIVVSTPPRRDTYTCYLQQMFVDRLDVLYLEFSFTDQKEKDFPHLLAVSIDRGVHWQLASTDIFQRNILRSAK